MATNKWGLDSAYFKKNLDVLSRDVENYTPNEMFQALSNLMMTAATQAEFEVKMDVKFKKR